MLLKLNDDYAVVMGTAAKISTKNVGSKGTSITNFSVMYHYDKETEERQYLNCIAWKDLSSKYLNRLDKGDMVLCIGRMEKDDYWSERNGKDEFKMTVEFAQVQTLYEDSFDVDEELDLSKI